MRICVFGLFILSIFGCGNEAEKFGRQFGTAFNFGMEQGACDMATSFPSTIEFGKDDSGFLLDLIFAAKARKNLNNDALRNDMSPADYSRLWELVRVRYIDANEKLAVKKEKSLGFKFEDYLEHTLTTIIKISAVENPGQFNWKIVSARKSAQTVDNQQVITISAMAVVFPVSLNQPAETKTIKSCDFERSR